MRRPRSLIQRRRHARASGRGPLGSRFRLPERVQHALGRLGHLGQLGQLGRRVRLRAANPLLLLVVGVGVVLGGAAPGPRTTTGAGASGSGARHRLAGAPRTSARWIDPADATAFALALVGATTAPPDTFTFTLPSGDILRGNGGKFASTSNTPSLPVIARQLSQLAPDAPYDTQTTVCGFAQLLSTGPDAPPGGQTVDLTLGVHIGQGGLIAYVGVDYAPPQVFFAAPACALVKPRAEMRAGCVSLTTCSTLGTPAQALGQYDQAVVAAAQSGAWDTVYTLTSQAVTAQYSAGDFATTMRQQVQRVGRITAIAPASAAPTIQFDAAGQAYFSAKQQVTVEHHSPQSVTSYYLLEGGGWMFWFSCASGTGACQ